MTRSSYRTRRIFRSCCRPLKTKTAVFLFQETRQSKYALLLQTTATPQWTRFDEDPLSFLKTLATNPTNSLNDRTHRCVVCYEIINYIGLIMTCRHVGWWTWRRRISSFDAECTVSALAQLNPEEISVNHY